MNFRLYINGTPSNYNQYPADNYSQLLKSFIEKQNSDLQLTIYRIGQLVFYSYSRRLPTNGPDIYFGICLVFNGVCIRNTWKFVDIIDKVYSTIILNGKILQIIDKGKVTFTINNFYEIGPEIERIRLSLQNSFMNIGNNFTTLSTNFKTSNEAKGLTTLDDNNTILETFQSIGYVKLIIDDKSDRELNTTFKEISRLNLEYHKQVNKIISIKRRNKVLMTISLLLLAVTIGCFLALSSYNRKSRVQNNKIKYLEAELHEKNDTILSQIERIYHLQNQNSN
jgi:hypothetical protein